MIDKAEARRERTQPALHFSEVHKLHGLRQETKDQYRAFFNKIWRDYRFRWGIKFFPKQYAI